MKLFDEPKKERKPKDDDKLVKNQECVGCIHLFECKGRPRSIISCLNKETKASRF